MDIFDSDMKTKIASHRLLRVVSLASAPLMYLSDIFLSGASGAESFALSVWWSLLILLLYPSCDDPLMPSAVATVAALGAAAVLKCFAAPASAFVCTGSALLLAFGVYRCARRFRDIPQLFLISSLWPWTLEHLGLLHMSAFMFTGLLLCAADGNMVALSCMCIVLPAFYALQYVRTLRRSTLFIGAKKEELIKQGQRSAGYRMPVQYVDSDTRSAVLFNEVVKIMETKRPYLRDGFSADELARMAGTNRLYLSKAINFHSGRNFNQLVNYYRIKYAVELMKKDRDLRMNEVAMMSGFHTVVSFNMAFKLNEHTTPSEYARGLKTCI